MRVTGMKKLEKHQVRSHNKVRTLFAENKVRFARAEQLWSSVWFWYFSNLPQKTQSIWP